MGIETKPYQKIEKSFIIILRKLCGKDIISHYFTKCKSMREKRENAGLCVTSSGRHGEKTGGETPPLTDAHRVTPACGGK